MKIFNFDDEGVFVRTSDARLDPLESTKEKPVYLIPRNATSVKPPVSGDEQTVVFSGGKWKIVEDHRGTTAYDQNGHEVLITKTGSLDELDLSVTAPAPDPLTAREQRDLALASLTHDFGDGRVIQTRPKDEQNIRNAIEIMEANTIPSIGWVMIDDKKYDVTVDELKTALTAGQLAAVQVWNNYNPEG